MKYLSPLQRTLLAQWLFLLACCIGWFTFGMLVGIDYIELHPRPLAPCRMVDRGDWG